MTTQEHDTIAAGDAHVAAITIPYRKLYEYIIDDPSLDPLDWCLYATLVKYVEITRKKHKRESAFPGQKRLAEECRVSVDTIKRRTDKLEQRGWISRTRRGFGATMLYKVFGPSESDETRGSGPGIAHSPQFADSAPVRTRESAPVRNHISATVRNHESATVRTNHYEGKQDKVEQDEVEQPSPQPPKGGDGDGPTFSASRSASPTDDGATSNPSGAQNSRSRREANHSWWTGAEGEKRQRVFTALWEQHPRKEGLEAAKRRFRLVLGGDADDVGITDLMLRTHEEQTWEWVQRDTEMQPNLSNWLRNVDWEYTDAFEQLRPSQSAREVDDRRRQSDDDVEAMVEADDDSEASGQPEGSEALAEPDDHTPTWEPLPWDADDDWMPTPTPIEASYLPLAA